MDTKPRKIRSDSKQHQAQLRSLVARPMPAQAMKEFQEEQRIRRLKLAYLQSLKYPPRALDASKGARLARHYPQGL